jgi:hypothetical protein
MVSETLGFYPQLTRLVAREDFIKFSYHESFKSYKISDLIPPSQYFVGYCSGTCFYLQQHNIYFTSNMGLLTIKLRTWTFGRAVLYSMNIRLTPIPRSIPQSSPIPKHAMNVTAIGMRSTPETMLHVYICLCMLMSTIFRTNFNTIKSNK